MVQKADSDEWARSLPTAWREAALQYAFEVTEAEFIARAGLLPTGFDAHIAPGELYLLCGCQKGNDAALRAFREKLLGRARAALARMQLDGALAEEAEQSLWSKFMVAEDRGELPLWRYVGRGKLSAFLQVSATRAAVSLLRREGRYVAADDDALSNSLGVADGVDLALLKSTYRGTFSAALEQALATLTPRQRTLLKLHHLDRVTGDQLAKMYSVHRATVTRWLAEARHKLFSETRDRVMQKLELSPSDFHSLMGVVLSRLDVTLSRALGS